MATIALAAFAPATLGPGALFALGIGASVIDSLLIFPALFPEDPIEAGKFGDIKLLGAAEGTPEMLSLGQVNKIPGILLWASPTKTITSTTRVGKNSTVVNSDVFASVTVQICRGEIEELLKVWANGEVIYDVETDAQANTHTDFRITGFSGAGLSTEAYLKIPGSSNINLLDYGVGGGATVDLSDFSNGANNVTGAIVLAAGGTYVAGSAVNDTWLLLRHPSAAFIYETAGLSASKTVTQAVTGWAPGVQRFGVPKIVKGTTTQGADAHMESFEGVGQVPGYRGRAYVRFNDLDMTPYNGGVPNLEFLVKMKDVGTIEQTIDAIFNDADVDSSSWDAPNLGGAVSGYVVRGVQEAAKVLQPLLIAYDLVPRERDDQVVFMQRSALDRVPLVLDNLVKRAGGGALDVKAESSWRKPGEVSVEHINKDRDWKQGVQRASIATNRNADILKTSILLVLTENEAREVANRLLWASRVDVHEFEFQLPPSFMRVEAGDVLLLTAFDQDWEMIVTTRVAAPSGRILITAQSALSSQITYTYDAA